QLKVQGDDKGQQKQRHQVSGYPFFHHINDPLLSPATKKAVFTGTSPIKTTFKKRTHPHPSTSSNLPELQQKTIQVNKLLPDHPGCQII
ncbi:hypothetical protein, partial [Trichloromonas sp.]|uniref:hypothetical protein n=1 Tax=Trichloromonas sp. TaxID=3069249 RepID=UPI003D8180D1